MAKPATLPGWAPSGAAIVDPGAGLKASGWAGAEKPAAEHHNWLFKWISDWCAWLNGLTDEALTWAAEQHFGAGIHVTDGDVVIDGTAGGHTHGVDAKMVKTAEADARHAEREIPIPAASGQTLNSSVTIEAVFEPTVPPGAGADKWTGQVASGRVSFPIPVNVGDRLKSVSLVILDTDEAVSMVLMKQTPGDASAAQVGTTQTSSGGAARQTLTVGGLTETVATGTTYTAVVIFSSGADFASQLCYGGKAVADRVA